MEALLICPKCGASHAPGATFCQQCGRPLSQLAMSGPNESILTRGFAYREASNRPHKPILVAGMLLIFVPTLLFFVGLLCVTAISVFTSGSFWDQLSGSLVVMAFSLGGIYISGKLIARTLRNYFRHRRDEAAAEASDADGR